MNHLKEKSPPKKEILLKGLSVSDGIALGNLFILKQEDKEIQHVPITDIDHEIQRYRSALNHSRYDLQEIQNRLKQQGSKEAVTIIDSHIQMLDDPFITTEMEERIRIMMHNTESVFHSAITDYEKQFSQIKDDFFQKRLTDVKDVTFRILHHLNPSLRCYFEKCPADSIIFSKELTPSHTAEASCDQVKAFITEIGGKTSHAGLIARARGIPFVANIDEKQFLDYHLAKIIVDGYEGVVIIHPSEETENEYGKRIENNQRQYDFFSNQGHVPSMTQDHVHIQVLANIENITDIPNLYQFDIPGIGLLRSEFLFPQKEIDSITHSEQYEVYKKLFQISRNFPLTFRLFDFGGDKTPIGDEETNPALGCRSIRYLLRNPEILKAQVRALLQNVEQNQFQILLPLITDTYEILEAKQLIEEVKQELNFTQKIPIGAMVEVPSCAIMIDLIAQNCDFVSIGTNDLIQYTLAVDRMNPSVADMYRGSHPSVVRLLHSIYQATKSADIEVTICGEMASNPLYTPLLIGLGYRKLSCSPRYIPIIKHIIRNLSVDLTQSLSSEMLSCSSYKQTYALLEEFYQQYIKNKALEN